MRVAVIIPCRNEVNYIVRCVDSILNQQYPESELVIYVVDGLSDDGTREVLLKEYSNNARVVILDNLNRTTPFALNAGIHEAKAEVSIIFGAHAEMHVNYVKYCVEILQNDPSVDCVGGIIENVNENETAQIISECMSSSFGVGNAHFRTGNAKGYVDTVAFGAYRTVVFDKIGYFNEALTRNQDDELNYRLTKAGSNIFLDHRIRSNYYVRGSYQKLSRQYYQYGYWKVYVNTLHKTITTWRQLIPFLFVSYLICAAFGVMLLPAAAILMLSPFLAYLILACAISFKIGRSWNSRFQRVIVFFLLHSTYGWGYLKGVINFVLLHKKPNSKAELSSR